jgi:hypothetical protein
MRYLKSISVLIAVAAFVFACAAPLPQKDVDAATAAFNDAKTAQADVYAPDSWKAANAANDAVKADLTAKKYDKTKEKAKTLLDAATKAKADAATGKAAAQKNATQLVSDIAALDPIVKAEIAKAVAAGKKTKLDVKAIQTSYNDGVKAFADAQTAVGAGNFADANAKLPAIKDGLLALQKDLEAAGFKK